ncbi:unnamed protein product [Calypogeia fissa]
MGIPGEIKYKLNSVTEIPALGCGTVAFSDTKEEARKGIQNAFKAGYRHFDTASKYKTEELLGECLNEAFESGLFKREGVFVTSKLWVSDNSAERVPVAFHKSLKNLGLEYVDLFLIHFPFTIKPEANDDDLKEEDVLPFDIKGVWREFEKLKEQGLAKAIGVSNFGVKRLQEMFALTGCIPAVNQVELHPLFQQRKLLDYCKRKGILVTAYSPFGAPGQPYSDPNNSVLENPVLKEVAAKHGKSAAQISLRWIIEQGAAVVGKSYNEKRLAQNADIFSWSLDEEDLDKIRGIQTQLKFVPNAFTYKGPYKTYEEFYDDSEE